MTRATRSPGLVARIGRLLVIMGGIVLWGALMRSFPVCPPVSGQSAMPAGCLPGGPSAMSLVVSDPWTFPGLTLALAGVLLVALDDARAVGVALVSDLHEWLLEVSHRER
jgi:hypothetical protein